MIATAVVAYFQDKPAWLVVVLAIAVGAILVCLASLIFKSYAFKATEKRRLKRLPRLVYDVHKRISLMRNKLIRETDWENVDTSKVISPLLDIFGNSVVDDNKIEELRSKLLASASEPSGIASSSDAIMERSDTSLESYVKKDFWYRFYYSQLDSYIPCPNKAIGDMVSRIINTSLSINNLIILQAYSSPDSLSLENMSRLTSFSDATRTKVYNVNVQAEKIMNDAITKACTQLNVLIDEYLAEAKVTK